MTIIGYNYRIVNIRGSSGINSLSRLHIDWVTPTTPHCTILKLGSHMVLRVLPIEISVTSCLFFSARRTVFVDTLANEISAKFVSICFYCTKKRRAPWQTDDRQRWIYYSITNAILFICASAKNVFTYRQFRRPPLLLEYFCNVTAKKKQLGTNFITWISGPI